MASITEDINYPKAVWEQLRRWRIVRAPLLAQLDIAYLRALETNDLETMASIVTQKNILRNITDYDFSQVRSIDSILTIWPECLGSIPDEFKD
jgi:hypothetical protein